MCSCFFIRLGFSPRPQTRRYSPWCRSRTPGSQRRGRPGCRCRPSRCDHIGGFTRGPAVDALARLPDLLAVDAVTADPDPADAGLLGQTDDLLQLLLVVDDHQMAAQIRTLALRLGPAHVLLEDLIAVFHRCRCGALLGRGGCFPGLGKFIGRGRGLRLRALRLLLGGGVGVHRHRLHQVVRLGALLLVILEHGVHQNRRYHHNRAQHQNDGQRSPFLFVHLFQLPFSAHLCPACQS